ncbi:MULTISPECIES: HNH endonuclease [unclassified Bacillus (in: firmicutes)]|uniref:HNH endonuclease n=1 Tax=unclassified Bacillus (in: firmicutes) TaxID=185979 RepID=UPI000BF0171D|nr:MULTISPECIES: HNH endonuclease [unclassified Bacillus (in: firmicutes)]PEJ60730.1 hypothetical protein CN692_01170 [Bacillus sp. AFS002410]PEL09763.1 hypothetical protein CN601_14550 [Bacillus sp. AFS017336]
MKKNKYPFVDDIQDVIKNIKQFNEDIKIDVNLQMKLSHFAAWYYVKEIDLFGPSNYIAYKDMCSDIYFDSDFLTEIDFRKTENILKRWFVKQPIKSLSNSLKENLYEYSPLRANYEMSILKTEANALLDEMYEELSILDDTPPIRTFPISCENLEFSYDSIEELQEWFLDELPVRGYQFKKGLNTPKGAILLFQNNDQIIASGKLSSIFEHPNNANGTIGTFIFDPSSICIFNPLNLDDMKLIWEEFINFSEVPQNLDKHKYDDFMNYLYSKNIRYALDNEMDEETFTIEVEKTFVDSHTPVKDEPKAKYNCTFITNKSNRNRTVTKRAIVEANFKCEIDESHSFFLSKQTGENYVEGHHLIPLEFEEMFDYNLDVEANVISLCPICHKKIHHGPIETVEKLIKKLYKNRKERLKNSGIEVKPKTLLSFYT